MSEIISLLHAGLLVSDLARARHFYESVIGLDRVAKRPELDFPGEWYNLGDGQQLHLMALPNPDAASIRPEHGGRDHHIAIAVRNLPALQTRLDAAGVSYSVSKSGRAALFCRDPDANTLEFVEVS